MKKYLVIGNPIEHSLSPKLHNYWFKKKNINANYDKRKIDKSEIQEIIYQKFRMKHYMHTMFIKLKGRVEIYSQILKVMKILLWGFQLKKLKNI